MLDDVERRRFLVKPAREDPVPAAVGLLHVKLDERPGELLVLPWCGHLARPQPNDDVFPADRLAGMERHVLHDAVALIEDAENGHSLRHRRDSTLAVGRRGGLPRRRRSPILLLGALAARSQCERDQQRCRERTHAYSGIQGS
jgi:hypothetical protein